MPQSTEFDTFDQSSWNGSRAFWFAMRKSTSGPGCMIVVVDPSAVNKKMVIGKMLCSWGKKTLNIN